MKKKAYVKPCISVVKVDEEGYLLNGTNDGGGNGDDTKEKEETDNGYANWGDLGGDEDEDDW